MEGGVKDGEVDGEEEADEEERYSFLEVVLLFGN